MGHDKSGIEYHGKPQREFLFDLLTPLCDNVYFSCKDKSGIPERLHPLEDRFEIDSPLNGVLTAFSVYLNAAWISVPVDMPFVNMSVIRYLLDHRDRSKMATCFYDSDGQHPEPLLTLWEPAAGIALRKFFDAGEFSPRAFLMKNHVNILSAPDPKILVNINSSDEFSDFRKGFTSDKG
jgi:molybdopterin-guanine dinucleotide biosynthesis protein A